MQLNREGEAEKADADVPELRGGDRGKTVTKQERLGGGARAETKEEAPGTTRLPHLPLRLTFHVLVSTSECVFHCRSLSSALHH